MQRMQNNAKHEKNRRGGMQVFCPSHPPLSECGKKLQQQVEKRQEIGLEEGGSRNADSNFLGVEGRGEKEWALFLSLVRKKDRKIPLLYIPGKKARKVFVPFVFP